MSNFNQYEEQVGLTAIYPHVGEGNIPALSYATLGLCGESGEVAEKIKKYIRDGTFDKVAIAKELGDVLWYLTRISNELGFSLEDIAEMNVSKLAARKSNNTLQGSGDDR